MASTIAGTGNQPYTDARVAYLARYLQTLVPGLRYDVAVKWINAERGVNGNVLGVTYHDATGQHLHTYSSQEAGLRAAASFLNNNSRYSNFLKVTSNGGTSSQQLLALTLSGWNLKYYAKHFYGVTAATPAAVQKMIFGRVIFQPSGAVTSGGTNAILTSAPVTGADAQQALALLQQAGITNLDPSHKFTHDEAVAIVEKLYHITPSNIGYNDMISRFEGMTVGDFIGQSAATGNQFSNDPLSQIAGTVSGFISTVTDIENLKYGMAFLVGVPLALIGFYLLAGVPTGRK